MSKKHPSPLPLTHALAWIVGSMFFFTGVVYKSIAIYLHHTPQKVDNLLRLIIQTGPQKEALKSQYLAEVLGLSVDYPQDSRSVDLAALRQKLLNTPLIAQAQLSLRKPNALYIDYTLRQPLAFLADFENLAIDREGYPLPFAPFFSPKNLPEIYLGLAPFGLPSEDPEKPIAKWGSSLKGKYLDLALEILAYTCDPSVCDYFNVVWIDVSRAFSKSCGSREIVLITQDSIYKQGQLHTARRILRLSTKQFTQQLGNYLKLREQLLEEDCKKLSLLGEQSLPECIIDLRIANLAFIEEKKL